MSSSRNWLSLILHNEFGTISITATTHQKTDSQGHQVLRRSNLEAELTYSIASAARIIADHTGAPDGMRRTRAGLELAKRFVADARDGGYKIMALRSFVKARSLKCLGWSDVFA